MATLTINNKHDNTMAVRVINLLKLVLENKKLELKLHFED